MGEKSLKRRRGLSVLGCLLVQLCVGIIYLWSVLKVPVAEALGCGTEALEMVSSYMTTAFVVGILLGGMYGDNRGLRRTCLSGVLVFFAGIAATAWITSQNAGMFQFSYAVVGGLGSGLAYSACISCVQKWLPARRGLATGLAVCAFGLSTVVFAPVFQTLISFFTSEATGLLNLRGLFMTLAMIFLILGLGGCLLIRDPERMAPAGQSVKDKGTDIPLSRAVRTAPFWYLFFTVFFINGAWNLAVPMLYDLGVERGLSAAAATFAVSFTGIPNAAGRLAMASASDRFGRRKCICLLAGLTALAAVAMIFVRGWGYILAVSVIAFAYGGPSSVNAAMTTDYFGSRNSGTNYGVIMLALGLSALFFNGLASTVLRGSATAVFLVAAASALLPIWFMAKIGKAPAAAAEGTARRRPRSLRTSSQNA